MAQWIVLSLVIEDDLEPGLQCVHCGRLYVHCSVELTAEGARCPFCGATAWLPELAQRKAGPELRLPPPSGIDLADGRSDWRIGISTRSAHFARLMFPGGFGLSALVGIIVFVTGKADDPLAGIIWRLVKGGFGVVLGAIFCAAWWAWGNYSISRQNGECIVYRGLGASEAGGNSR